MVWTENDSKSGRDVRVGKGSIGLVVIDELDMRDR